MSWAGEAFLAWVLVGLLVGIGRMIFASEQDIEPATAAMHALRTAIAWPIFAAVLVLTSPLYAWRLFVPKREAVVCPECSKRGPYR